MGRMEMSTTSSYLDLAEIRPPSRRVARFFSKINVVGLLLPLIIVTLWQAASTYQWVEAVFLPAPVKVAEAFWVMLTKQQLANDFISSVSIVGQALVYGATAAIVLGVAAGLSKRVEQFFGPTFDTLRHIPGIAWLPLIVLWLGIGAPAKVLVIAKAVFFPVFLNTLQGIRNVEKSHIELANVLTLNRWQMVRKVVLPSAFPSIMVSLRYAAGLAWAMVVIAEGLSGLEGLGFLIFRAQGLLLTDQLVVCMIIIGLVGFTIDRIMYLAQRRLLRWKQGFEG
ncbi:binding-protein-dependent transport systems inner membrane component [Rhodomicrobium vannielii ATCC 17100]|jgi:sulfonate transport system permease protein|uniref:Binding-protein-dependent transport systems inner membrane component n=3 Tax=Rhodomicrobium TaxID=1068 RepID=E3I4U8_RHOVT|nr:binding-protein-dependent transport systems inner membrane component [Rhodomicrobium vannielii ATCC 17100]